MAAGRPSKYQDEMLEQAYGLALLGANDEQIAKFFKITTSTYYEWLKSKEGLSEAIKEGKIKADADIAKSLFHRAKGYEYVEEEAYKVKIDKDHEEVRVVEVTKHAQPDTKAAMYWLNNRFRSVWSEKTILSNDPENPLPAPKELTAEALNALSFLMKKVEMSASMPSPGGSGQATATAKE